MARVVLLLGLAIIHAANAACTSCYVDASNGVDTSNCGGGTGSSACKSIAGTLYYATPGVTLTLTLAPGTYNEGYADLTSKSVIITGESLADTSSTIITNGYHDGSTCSHPWGAGFCLLFLTYGGTSLKLRYLTIQDSENVLRSVAVGRVVYEATNVTFSNIPSPLHGSVAYLGIAASGTGVNENWGHGAGWTTFIGCSFVGTTAAGFGGSVYVEVGSDVSYPVTFVDSTFTANTAQQGGAIYVNAPAGGSSYTDSTITVHNTLFQNCSASIGGGVMFLQSSEPAKLDLIMTSSYFLRNSATDSGGGIHYNAWGFLRVTGTTFKFNSAASNAGALYVLGSGSYLGAVLTETTFESNTAATGGAVYAEGGSQCIPGLAQGSSFQVLDSKFISNVASVKGGALATSSALYLIDGCTFTGNKVGTIGGGAIYQNDAASSTPWWGKNQGTSSNPHNSQASVLGFPAPCYCMTGLATGTLATYCSTCFSTLSSTGTNCVDALAASPAFGIPFGPTVQNSVFEDHQGTSAAYGIAFKFAGPATFSMLTSNVVGSYAKIGGGGVLSTDANSAIQVFLTDCVFANNLVDDSGGAINAGGGTITILRTTFQENKAGNAGSGGGGAIWAAGETILNVTDSSFLSNQAIAPLSTMGGGVMFGLAEVVSFTRCTFDGNLDQSKYFGGGVFTLQGANPSLYLESCIFTNNHATNKGGVAYLKSSRSVVYDQGSVYTNNCGPAGGGVAYISAGAQWTGFNSIFESNTASWAGGAFFVDAGKLYLGENAPMMLASGPISTGDAVSGARTGPIMDAGCYVDKLYNVNPSSSNLYNYDVCNFPAPYWTPSFPGPKVEGNTASYGCTFFNNTGSNGGGVHVFTKGYARLHNTMFRQNNATEYGGGVSVAPAGRTELTNLTCYDNLATKAGGCVYWADQDPTMNSFASGGATTNCSTSCYMCTHKYNEAQYGPFLATDTKTMQAVFSRQWAGIVPTGNDTVGEPLGTVEAPARRSRRQVYALKAPSLSGVASVPPTQIVYRPGIRFNLYFLAYDYFGTIVKSAENGNDLLAIVRPSEKNIGRDMYEFSGVVSKTKAPGAVEIVPIIFGGKALVNYTWVMDYQWYRPDISPGTMKKIAVTQNHSSYTQKCAVGEKTVYDENPLRLQEGNAKWGEGYWETVIKECVWCKSGKYSVDSDVTSCNDCPTAGAYCDGGGSYIIPKKNYWRGYPGDDIYKCPYPGACLQGQGLEKTICEYGYEGILCATCQEGWVEAGRKCVECGVNRLSADMLALIVLMVIGGIVVTKIAMDKWFAAPEVKGAVALKILMAKKKKLARGIAIMNQVKILFSYMQVTVALISVGDVNYPGSFMDICGAMSFINLDIVALFRGICVGPSGGFTFFDVLSFNVFMPIGVFALVVLHYQLKKPGADAEDTMENRTYGGNHWTLMLMLLFAIFPNTSKNVIDFFRCQEIYTTKTTSSHYMMLYYEHECYTGEWNSYLPIGILGLILYPIGVPALFFGCLYKEVRKDKLMDEQVLAKVGFLYTRFKHEFWWYETCELIRKLIVTSLVNFVRPDERSGTPTQILVALCINTFFLVMFLACWPFKAQDDNMLMALSFVAITVTLFGAIILNAEIDWLDSWPDGTATGIILGANGALILLYIAMLCNYQLPYICEFLMPDCITNSRLNCFRKDPAKKKSKLTDEERAARASVRAKFGSVEIVPTPLPPPPPLPLPAIDMGDEELYEEMEKYFHRYDLDESGFIDAPEELQHLTTNLCFRLQLPLSGGEIDAVVESAGVLSPKNQWSVEDFCEWFEERFLGGDEDLPSLAGEAMTMISMYQNLEMNNEMMEEYYSDDDDDDGGDDGGD